MSQIKQILRLHQQGKPIKAIVRSLSVSRNTVRKYLALQQASGRDPADLLAASDEQLQQILLPGDGQPGREERYLALLDQADYFHTELQRTGVTRWLLWSEYRQSHPDGYSYSQFCWHLQALDRASQSSLANLPHPPGEQCYIDFAGKRMEIVDPLTGELRQVQVFVATLGASQYSWVEATESQQTEDFIGALARALAFFGDVPQTIIPDNLKAAVVKADRYEPALNQLLADFANHYGTVILPTRPGRPRDKSLVEAAVRDVYRHVFAPLRNRRFFSLGELNEAIKFQLEIWHDRPFQGHNDTRWERFEGAERPALGLLPVEPFLVKKYRQGTVCKNSHIRLGEDKHYYSVPCGYIGRKATVIYTGQVVEIYCGGHLVASHLRDRSWYGYSTVKEHLPSHHQHWLDRSPGWYRRRAHSISPEVGQLIERILASRAHPEQAYRSCDGVLGLHRKVGAAPLTEAARLALELGECTYSFLARVIKNGMATPGSKAESPAALPDHPNIRGKTYFQGSFTFNSKNPDL